MDIGQLHKRVVIQTRSQTRDAANAPVDVWTDTNKLWANIAPQYSAITSATQEFISRGTYRCTFLWSRQLAIAVTNRIVYVDPSTGTIHKYEVQSIFPLDANQPNTFVVAMCYELDGAT